MLHQPVQSQGPQPYRPQYQQQPQPQPGQQMWGTSGPSAAHGAPAPPQTSGAGVDADGRVVYTVQDTSTQTRTQETEYGGVIVVTTTTVARTITERLVASDEDDSDADDADDNGSNYGNGNARGEEAVAPGRLLQHSSGVASSGPTAHTSADRPSHRGSYTAGAAADDGVQWGGVRREAPVSAAPAPQQHSHDKPSPPAAAERQWRQYPMYESTRRLSESSTTPSARPNHYAEL